MTPRSCGTKKRGFLLRAGMRGGLTRCFCELRRQPLIHNGPRHPRYDAAYQTNELTAPLRVENQRVVGEHRRVKHRKSVVDGTLPAQLAAVVMQGNISRNGTCVVFAPAGTWGPREWIGQPPGPVSLDHQHAPTRSPKAVITTCHNYRYHLPLPTWIVEPKASLALSGPGAQHSRAGRAGTGRVTVSTRAYIYGCDDIIQEPLSRLGRSHREPCQIPLAV